MKESILTVVATLGLTGLAFGCMADDKARDLEVAPLTAEDGASPEFRQHLGAFAQATLAEFPDEQIESPHPLDVAISAMSESTAANLGELTLATSKEMVEVREDIVNLVVDFEQSLGLVEVALTSDDGEVDPFHQPSCVQNCVNEWDTCIGDRIPVDSSDLEIWIGSLFCAVVAELCVLDCLVPG